MMRKLLLFVWTLFAQWSLNAQIIIPYERLERLKEACSSGQEEALEAVRVVVEEVAEEYLAMEPLRVTEKEKLPPSGDPRDYMTLSPYWWPDPEKEDGLPYIRRDGERNPEVYDYPERVNSGRLGEATLTLALLYHVTTDERYADQCAILLRSWFLDPEHGMHPNMRYAQMIPGRTTLRGTGIIDSRRFLAALSAATLIAQSEAWSDEDQGGLVAWTSDFLSWLESSEQGKKEFKSVNNHGLWYDAIRLMCMAFLGEKDRMEEVMRSSLIPRIEAQVSAEMTLPHELERTLSLHYTTFALEAVSVATALIGPSADLIWRHERADGCSLVGVLERLIPYYISPEVWPHAQIQPFEQARGARLLDQMGRLLERNEWVECAAEIGCATSPLERMLYFELTQ